MFERFTERARQVVVLAQQEARGLKHNHIGTEHILLGLLDEEEGLAARVLHSHRITAERVRDEVNRMVGPGDEELPAATTIPFTPRAKKILELALREGLSLGHNHIGTEQLLLGLLRENGGVAAQILPELGADPQRLREEVIRMLSGPRDAAEWVPPEDPPPQQAVRPPQPPRARPPEPPWAQAVAPLRGSWLHGLDPLLAQLGADIWEAQGRAPDLGDLLLVLATLPGTLAFDGLRTLGLDPDALWATIERLRRERERELAELSRRLEEIRAAKDKAVEAGQLDRAVELRDQERELRAQSAPDTTSPDVLDEMRRRLGIPDSG